MDTLLKTHNKIEFLPQFHGFSEKVSNSSSVKIQIQELRFGPKKVFSRGGRNGCVEASSSALLELVPETKKENLEFDLPMYDPSKGLVVDLAVVGGGPAGLAVAQQVSEAGLSVCSIDPSPQLIWPNNYGVWVDEFDAMNLLDCLDTTWSGAVVYVNDKTKTRVCDSGAPPLNCSILNNLFHGIQHDSRNRVGLSHRKILYSPYKAV